MSAEASEATEPRPDLDAQILSPGSVPAQDDNRSPERDVNPDLVAVLVEELKADRVLRREIADALFHLVDLVRIQMHAEPVYHQLGHGDSSRCAGDGTPTNRSVEAAAETAAGSVGGPLAPGRPAAGGAA